MKNGFSLIEMLVVMGIMSIAALGMMTMMDNQNKDFRFLAEKFEIRDTKSILTGVMDENGFCGCFLQGKTFNTITGLINETITSVPLNYETNCTPSALKIIPSVRSKLSASSNITVASLSLLAGTEVVPGSGKYSSSVEVQLGNVSRSVRPIKVPIFFKINTTAGTPTARNVTNCMSSAAEVPPVQGFCTPRNDWDNGSALNCPSYPGYDVQRLTGAQATTWRGSGCCYLPQTAGGNGWCSPSYPSWNTSYSGCLSNANYRAHRLQAIQFGSSDNSICCFIPNTLPKNPQAFTTGTHLNAWSSNSGCGGPYTHFHAYLINVVTPGSGRSVSCSYIPKY